MRSLRKAAWWALSPFAWGTAMTAAQSRCTVLTGPFAGLRYPPSLVPRLLFHGPYQVGSFELELHPAIERIIAAVAGDDRQRRCRRGLLRDRACDQAPGRAGDRL